MEKYEVSGDFIILFPLEKQGNTYEEINMLQDVISNALREGHIEVKRITVRTVQKAKEKV